LAGFAILNKMLVIRMARIGTNKKPFYRIILCEKGRDNYGKISEILGTYNTFTKDLQVEAEKIKVWIAKGAKLSATLNNLFIEKKIISGEKAKSRRLNTEKLVKKREDDKKKAEESAAKAKAEEEAKAAEAAKKAEAAAAEAKADESVKAAASAAPAEEKPVEEPKAI
jgi:small subunit ribosomal protein S16